MTIFAHDPHEPGPVSRWVAAIIHPHHAAGRHGGAPLERAIEVTEAPRPQLPPVMPSWLDRAGSSHAGDAAWAALLREPQSASPTMPPVPAAASVVVRPVPADEAWVTRMRNRLERTEGANRALAVLHERWDAHWCVVAERLARHAAHRQAAHERMSAAVAAQDLAQAYAEGGTAVMLGLAAQVRQRIVADALAGAVA